MSEILEYNGLVCDMDCDNCNECIFEVKLDNMIKQNDLTKITCCNNCVCATSKEADCSGGQLSNWYCSSKGTKRIIEMSVLSTAEISIPKWCPMGLHKPTIQTTETTKAETKKELSWIEKKNLWESITPICKWEDIKASSVFHVPPVLGEKRKDIIVTSVTEFSFQYRVLSNSETAPSTCIYTVYKTGFWWKFMSKHKIKKIELVKAN